MCSCNPITLDFKLMSRPEKAIDWAKVDNLLMAGCIGTQIAPHFDMHPETFYRRIEEKYGVGFTEYSALKKQQGNSLLLAKQLERAVSGKGDNTMLIWLGKQRLGQKESLDNTGLSEITFEVKEKLSEMIKDQTQIKNVE